MERKKVNRLLKAIGSVLPQEIDQFGQRYPIKGRDIKLTGLKVPEDMVIDPDSDYYFSIYGHIENNHGR